MSAVLNLYPVTLIMNNTLADGGAKRVCIEVEATTVVKAAMVAAARFSYEDYEYVKVIDPRTKKTHCWDKYEAERLTGVEGMV